METGRHQAPGPDSRPLRCPSGRPPWPHQPGLSPHFHPRTEAPGAHLPRLLVLSSWGEPGAESVSSAPLPEQGACPAAGSAAVPSLGTPTPAGSAGLTDTEETRSLPAPPVTKGTEDLL